MHLLQCNSNTFNSNACICFKETTIISIQLHQFWFNCARFNPFNHFEPTVIILVWLQLRLSHFALVLNLAVVISSYLHAFQAKLLPQANCNYFRLSAPVFGAKYNIFQLSAPVGEKTWIISIWLQFKCTYFEPTATISILLHLFRANVTRIETIWFFMFRANNNFNLTAPFLSGVSYFFCYAVPIFRANFTKQWTLSNQLQFFPASCMCVCVCLRHLISRVFQDDCTCSEPHTIISLQSCTAFNSTAVMRPHWVRYFWQVSIFRLCQLSCTDKKNQTNCIAKILISAWRVVGNLLLINVELDKNSQHFNCLLFSSMLLNYLMIHLTAFF